MIAPSRPRVTTRTMPTIVQYATPNPSTYVTSIRPEIPNGCRINMLAVALACMRIATDERRQAATRIALLLREAALVLDCSEEEVRDLIESGELVDVSRDRSRRIGIEELNRLVCARVQRGELSPLATFLLGEIVRGNLEVPHRVDDCFAFVVSFLSRGCPR